MNGETHSEINLYDEKAFRIAWLVAGFLRHTLTDDEQVELDDWVTANMDNQRLFEQLIDEKNLAQWIKEKQGIDTEAALEKMKEHISFPMQKLTAKKQTARLWWYAAAGLLIAIVALVLLFNTRQPSPNPAPMVKQFAPNDIPPGFNRATLALENGKILVVDSTTRGTLSTDQPSVTVNQQQGMLSYTAATANPGTSKEIFNTLATPPAGQYQLLLSDGTKVWLNASSSLHYPVLFTSGKRTVSLTGEAYFEVAKDSLHPFEVQLGNNTVTVLGTHFNINAYTDEPTVNIALAEGSVKLNHSTVLKPGEQAVVHKNGETTVANADLTSILGWKNGNFVFHDAPIDAVLRQVGRWYDAKIDNKAGSAYHLTADISRNVPVSEVLHLLQSTQAIKFSVNNKVITVTR